MAFSFTQIEKDKSNSVGLVFFALIGFYFVVALLIYAVAKGYFLYEGYTHYDGPRPKLEQFWSWQEAGITLFTALIAGALHFLISISNLISKMLAVLRAQPLNAADTYHAKFQNILDEVSVATGGRTVRGVVLSTSAMNAFALADFEGNAVIGVTEGLLNRLNRSQLEAVVAHEMAHILTGDCLETTVVTSLFALYGGLLAGLQEGMGHTRQRTFVLMALMAAVLAITMVIATLMKMFVSRQREYRADAIAVRLTRDPLSLAQALYIISRRWRGGDVSNDQLSPLFIMSPSHRAIDEREGLGSELFSTHPPVQKRIDILLNMAHADMTVLEGVERQEPPQVAAPEHEGGVIPLPQQAPPQWDVFTDGVWRGPYGVAELAGLGTLGYDSFIRKAGSAKPVRLLDDADIKGMIQGRQDHTVTVQCPICHVNLDPQEYKGGQVLKCPMCAGSLLVEEDVSRILARDDYYFNEHIHRLGDALMAEQGRLQIKGVDLRTAALLTCPRCPDPRPQMLRNFYTLAYPIEVDRCSQCHSIWFDKTELEVLQYLIDKAKRAINTDERR